MSAAVRGRMTLAGLAVGGAVVIGIVLRFVAPSPLWLDEALSVNIARLPLGDLSEALRHDGNPPLYYVLLHWWMGIVGESDGAVRALSGLLAVLSLPLMYLAGLRIGSRRLAWTAAALLALNPFALRYATEVRMYSLLMVLVLAGFVLVHDALDRPSVLRLVGIALVAAALILTHYWAIWLLGAVVAMLGWTAWKGSPDHRGSTRRVLAAVVGGSLVFVVWLPVFIDQAAHTGTPWAGASRPTVAVGAVLEAFGGPDLAEAQLLGMALAGLFVLGLMGRASSGRIIELDLSTVAQARVPAILVGLTLALGVSASLLVDGAFASRYAAVILPMFLLVVAAGVSRFSGGWWEAAVLGVVLAMGAAVGGVDALDDRTQVGELAAAILAGDPAGADLGAPLVVYCPDQLGPSTSRLIDDLDQVVYPDLVGGVVGGPERVDWYDYLDRQATGDPAGFAASVVERAGPTNGIWVVSSASYEGTGEKCNEVVQVLGELRSGGPLIGENSADFFEQGQLSLFLPE